MPAWPIARNYLAPTLQLRAREIRWGERTIVMGIVNVTPDSFSGDGTGMDVAAAVQQALRFERDGADIIDIGAESTRPGAGGTSLDEELERLLPSLRAVRRATALPISVDTYRAEVGRAAIDAGADMLNDIHGLRAEPELAAVAARSGVPVVVMHNQRGRTTHDVAGDIAAGIGESQRIAREAGIPAGHLILDPGFGFGWKPEENLEILRRLPELWETGLPILAGTSRKSTLGMILDAEAQDRLEGTAATVTAAIAGGADIVRVHDVREMARVARVADAIYRGRWRSR